MSRNKAKGTAAESDVRDPCNCGETVRAWCLAHGIDAHTTTVPPIFDPGYEPLDMRCPHGTLWFCEPTTDQIAQWAKDGVK